MITRLLLASTFPVLTALSLHQLLLVTDICNTFASGTFITVCREVSIECVFKKQELPRAIEGAEKSWKTTRDVPY